MAYRLPRRLALIAALSAVAILLVILFFRSIDGERTRLADSDRVVVEVEPLRSPHLPGVSLWLAEEPPRDVKAFAGRVYMATSAGLAVYEPDGRPVRRYTTMDGLPESSLTCLEEFQGRLFVGTSGSGLLAFDGEQFTRYRFDRPEAAHVSALEAAGGELLVGTFEAGVLEFDGSTFTRRFQSTLGAECRQVTALLGVGPRLYVGTHDAGLFEWREGSVVRWRTNEGLPSSRIVGMAERDGSVLAATDLGVVELAGASPRLVNAAANATGIAVRGGRVYVSTLTQGLALGSAQGGSGGPLVGVSERRLAPPAAFTAPLPTRSVLRVRNDDGVLWALTDQGAFASVSDAETPGFERFGEPIGSARLAAGHVAALSVDGRGRLVVGYFDGGVDVLDTASGERLDRIEDPALREINAMLRAAGDDGVWIASSAGVASFDGGQRTRMLGRRDGLVGANATAICALPDGGIAVATSGGVTFFDGVLARSLSAFHGLPNNHVYSVVSANGKVYAGTLGGLAEIDGLRVSRVFTTAGSPLPHNWVNALQAADGRVFVGTYGGGVAMLLPTGEIVPYEETAGLDVNPGAMLLVDRRLYVGTLGAGAYVLDLDTGQWTRIVAGLGSPSVTAFAADALYLYVGTENGITRIERSALS